MGKLVEYMGDESGASAAEYALILALIAAAITGALFTLRGAIQTALNTTSTNMGYSS